MKFTSKSSKFSLISILHRGGVDSDKTGRKRTNRGVIQFSDDIACQAGEDEEYSDDSFFDDDFEEEHLSELKDKDAGVPLVPLIIAKEEQLSEEEVVTGHATSVGVSPMAHGVIGAVVSATPSTGTVCVGPCPGAALTGQTLPAIPSTVSHTPPAVVINAGPGLQDASAHVSDDARPRTPSLSELVERLNGMAVFDLNKEHFDQLEIALADYLVPEALADDQVVVAREAMLKVARVRTMWRAAVAEYDLLEASTLPPLLVSLRGRVQTSTSHVQALRHQATAGGERIQQKKKELEALRAELAALEAEQHLVTCQLHVAESESEILTDDLAIEERRYQAIKKSRRASAWRNIERLSKMWDDLTTNSLRSLPR